MADDPRTLPFWTAEERTLWQAMEPLVSAAFVAGAEGAARFLPTELEPLADFDFINRAARRFLESYRLDTVAGITATTRRETIARIRSWMASGDPVQQLLRDLRPLYGKTRAENVGITEVTRIFAEGNNTLWRSTGVVAAVRWRTAVDERVCPLCRPLEGQVIPMGGGVDIGREQMAQAVRDLGIAHDDASINRTVDNLIKWHGTRVELPPRHPRCRCWIQPIVDEGLFRRELERSLVEDFFAKVKAGQYPEVYVAWQP